MLKFLRFEDSVTGFQIHHRTTGQESCPLGAAVRSRPYGQPGPLPIMVTLVTLLIELETQIL